MIGSDGGGLLLGEMEARTLIVERIVGQIRAEWTEAKLIIWGERGYPLRSSSY